MEVTINTARVSDNPTEFHTNWRNVYVLVQVRLTHIVEFQ